MTDSSATEPMLAERLARAITLAGPIPVSQFMGAANAHYYATRDPLGRAGDFTTAPEISQLFGELVGIFLISAWQAHGSPVETRLIEGGPGRGTMMADILKTIAALAPSLYSGLSVTLMETSPALRARQKQTLATHAGRLFWVDQLADAEDGFTLFVALLTANHQVLCDRLIAFYGRVVTVLIALPFCRSFRLSRHTPASIPPYCKAFCHNVFASIL